MFVSVVQFLNATGACTTILLVFDESDSSVGCTVSDLLLVHFSVNHKPAMSGQN